MPELPEVQATVDGLNKHIVGLTIADIWTNYNSPYFKGSETIKDPIFFRHFRKEVLGKRIISISRRAKNILIRIGNPGRSTAASHIILVHMKMTGHLLYGQYRFNVKNTKDPWEAIAPESLKDPYNRHVRFLLSFSNGKHLALSDVRRFAKVTLLRDSDSHLSDHLRNIGPEPLDPDFKLSAFTERLKLRHNAKIKQVLTDQTIIAGIGNIYADESLWRAGIHPLEKVCDISDKKMRVLFETVQTTLKNGIDFGGDSTSDYRSVLGQKGKFHETHNAYRRTGSKCDKKGCRGTITRIVIGSRSAHFCDKHQVLTDKMPNKFRGSKIK